MALEEEGTVLSVDDNEAVVAVGVKSACSGCPSSAICSSDENERRLTAINAAHARPGQKVLVVMHSRMYLKGTMIVYGLPAISLMAGAILGKNIADNLFPGSNPDLWAAGTGFTAMTAVFMAVRRWSSNVAGKAGYQPVIERILDE